MAHFKIQLKKSRLKKTKYEKFLDQLSIDRFNKPFRELNKLQRNKIYIEYYLVGGK